MESLFVHKVDAAAHNICHIAHSDVFGLMVS